MFSVAKASKRMRARLVAPAKVASSDVIFAQAIGIPVGCVVACVCHCELSTYKKTKIHVP